MLVRALGLAALVFGALVWTGRAQYLGAHFVSGFVVAAAVFVLAVIALTKSRVIPGILGVLFAVLLPVVGLKQLPLTFHALGAIQLAHIVLALAVIGVAESLFAAIRRPR
jgi:presenilin-like A22 family membrane protease